jgi:hypothetical protein
MSRYALNPREARDLLIVLAVLFSTRLFFIAIAPDGFGSTDLRSWSYVAGLLDEGKNPYAITDKLNWPPFWMQIIYLLSRVTGATGIDFPLVVKSFLVAVEAVLAAVLYLAASRLSDIAKPLDIVMVAIVANPVALLLIVQHCNFDVIVGLWILLFFWSMARFAESGRAEHWLLATMFLGVAIWTKTVPLCLLPLALYGIKQLPVPTRIVGLFLVAAPVTIAMSVIWVLAPDAVVRHVLEYRSYPGYFGISGILVLLNAQQAISAAGTLFTITYLAALVYAGAFFYRRESLSRSTLLGAILLILLSVPVLGPGYAPQYAYWFLPLLALYYSDARPGTRRILAALYVVMGSTYITEYALFPSHGQFLQYLLDSRAVADWSNALSTQGGQTLVRMPLFAFYLATMTAIARDLRSRSTGGERR